jgi:hypothetical protein
MKKPKDLSLGEVAYHALYKTPQVSFDDLSMEAQMRFVTVARAVIEEWRKVTPKKEATEEQREKWREQKRRQNGGSHVDAQVSKKARKGFIIKSIEEKVRDWDIADGADAEYLTDKANKHRSAMERKARARMTYRDRERVRLGLEPKHPDLLR